MKLGPNFIIVGAMKCATSTLHEQLNHQQGIFMTHLKEPNFFSNDEVFAKGLPWYRSLFEAAGTDDLCGESSTHYTKLPTYPETIHRICEHFPNVKVIYVMRHPIDRLVSQYIHEWSQRVVDVDINQAVETFPELISYSQYSMQLQPYIENFGFSRVLPVFFERLFKYPQSELERICSFLDYPYEPQWTENINPQNVSRERMRKSAWRDFIVDQPVLAALRRQLVPKEFRTWVRGLWTIKKKPELSQQNIAYLKSVFDQDLSTLGSYIGLPLSCDSFKQVVLDNDISWSSSIELNKKA